tara:strand:- start:404 stop:589 length:186 start_codon:yes stop_codon:yes gene_type:complete
MKGSPSELEGLTGEAVLEAVDWDPVHILRFHVHPISTGHPLPACILKALFKVSDVTTIDIF